MGVYGYMYVGLYLHACMHAWIRLCNLCVSMCIYGPIIHLPLSLSRFVRPSVYHLHSLRICLNLSIYLSNPTLSNLATRICLHSCISTYLSIQLSIHVSCIYLRLYLPVYTSVYLSVCLSIHPRVYGCVFVLVE